MLNPVLEMIMILYTTWNLQMRFTWDQEQWVTIPFLCTVTRGVPLPQVRWTVFYGILLDWACSEVPCGAPIPRIWKHEPGPWHPKPGGHGYCQHNTCGQWQVLCHRQHDGDTNSRGTLWRWCSYRRCHHHVALWPTDWGKGGDVFTDLQIIMILNIMQGHAVQGVLHGRVVIKNSIGVIIFRG